MEVKMGLKDIPAASTSVRKPQRIELALHDSLVEEDLSSADISVVGGVFICSRTQCERKSYEMVWTSWGIFICSRRMRILHIVMNGQGLLLSHSMNQNTREFHKSDSENALVILHDNSVLASCRVTRRRESDRLDIPTFF